SSPGDVLVVDNGGRRDEGCIGDLVTLEAKLAGISGIVIWGTHRDTTELLKIDLPVFSLGAFPAGPQRLDPRSTDALISVQIGQWLVSTDDMVFADANGVLFVPQSDVSKVAAAAREIRNTERQHAELMRAGSSFRTQVQFNSYLTRRDSDPGFDFRRHLRETGGVNRH
ncbi:MAG: RraA family protein, partial [bacterium]|nr:RraA family protein [bacterium]